MTAVIVCAILSILSIAISLYQIHTQSESDVAPEVLQYGHWSMMWPM